MKATPLALLVLLAACAPPIDEPPTPEPPTPPVLGDDDDSAGDDDDSTAPPPCAPEISLTPAEASVLPDSGLLSLLASGGTGAYTFTLTTDSSGAQLHPQYGTYLPGSVAGGDDVVTVADAGCQGAADAVLHVVEPLVVEPLDVLAPPGTAFTLSVSGGSGAYACSLPSGDTGGSVGPDCSYLGGGSGVDLIRVEDAGTGETVDVRVELAADALLASDPPRIYLPMGASWKLRTRAGSGSVTASLASGAGVSYADGWFEANAPGASVFDLVDSYTGQSATVEVIAVAALEGGFPRAGDNDIIGASASPGDLNGDGWPDLVLGIAEGDLGVYNSGIVQVYAGQAGGIAPTPAQTLGGFDYEDRFGSALHVADVTGDGEPDLLVGAYLSDVAGGSAGEVQLYPGLPGGFFAPTPSRSWTGNHGGDQFGYGLTTCDFNGDGRLDLAVGANADEDRSVPEITFSQGAVWIYLGGVDGLPEFPQQTIFGTHPDSAGNWGYEAELRIGSELAAGDVDGDGLCDLVVGAYEYEPPGENGNDGAIFVYRGTSTGGSSAGLEPVPVVAWRAIDPASRDSSLGRSMAVGDVDGDGRADILAGHYRDQSAGPARHGSARLFLSQGWSTPASGFLDADDADQVWSADGSSDGFGWEVALGDLTGDGLMDVVASGYSDEVGGGPSGAGAARVYAGLAGSVPDLVPTWEVAGLLGGDLFGVRVDTVADLDGDGMGELFVYASRAEEHGIHIGSPYLVPSGGGAFQLLENPGDSAGQKAGFGVAMLGDVDGDGAEDLLVGVPEYDESGSRINAGMAQLFAGAGPGAVQDVPTELRGFERYSDGDRWGWKVSSAGDFDGDGLPDFALLGRYEDRPASWPSAVVGDPACRGTLTNSGAVAIFLGTSTGAPSTQPAFLYFGPEESDSMRNLAGGFDLDGDGYGDVVTSGIDWDPSSGNDGGGFEVLYGRPADPSGITVICPSASHRFEGGEAGARLGRGLAGLPDIDGDGCDELAVGAYEEDFGYTNQGVVRVLWGYGAGCAGSTPEVTVLTPQDTNARAGYSLAGGGDVDGDGVGDLLIGGYSRNTAGNATGAVWLAPGAWLASLPREAFVTESSPSAASSIVSPLGGPWTLVGQVQDEQLGISVALLPGVGPGGTAGVAVGASRSNLPGVERVGGVRIHLFDPATGGLDPQPWAAFGGETFTPNGRVGEELSAGAVLGVPVLLVGAYRASSWGPSQGAAWLLSFP